ncbi:MAG: YhjD/YihY/BrkB family envelope integrity protein [Phycisphaerae bacterium]
MFNLRERLNRLRGHLKRLLGSPTHELDRWGRLAVYQMRLWRFCGRQLRRDRLVTVAGDLTFKTLLGLIPFLVLFLMVIGFFSRGSEIGTQVQGALFKVLNITEITVAVDGEEVGLAEQIERLVTAAGERLNMAATATIGIVFLFSLSMNVLATVEGAMNRIWQIRERRPLWKKLVMFWLVLTLGPPAVVLAIYATDYIAEQAAVVPAWLEVFGRWAVGLATVWFVLFVGYKLLPHLPVRSRAALTGAVVAGTLWHVIAKQAFGYYVHYAIGYEKVFGNLAVVPLFFIWIYVTWIFVLFGCELAYVIQNFGDLARAEAQQAERERGRFLASDFVALVAAAACAKHFREGRGPMPLEHLVDATGVGRGNLEELLGRLADVGLLARTHQADDREDAQAAYLPAREPDRIPLAEVLRAGQGRMPVPADPEHNRLYQAARGAYENLRKTCAEAAGRVTLADVVAQADALGEQDKGAPEMD